MKKIIPPKKEVSRSGDHNGYNNKRKKKNKTPITEIIVKKVKRKQKLCSNPYPKFPQKSLFSVYFVRKSSCGVLEHHFGIQENLTKRLKE